MRSNSIDTLGKTPAWALFATHFAFGLAVASLVQAAIDLVYWYGAQWFFVGTTRFFQGDVLHPMDSFAQSIVGMTAITAAVALVPALVLTAICRRQGIRGPITYMIGGALTGVSGVLAIVSNPFHGIVTVYAAGLGFSGAVGGYVFWRAGITRFAKAQSARS